jgi:putative FmdB family regulatory protein
MNHDDFDSRKIGGWSGPGLRKQAGTLVYVIAAGAKGNFLWARAKAYNPRLCPTFSEPSGNTMPIYAYKCGACGFAKDQLQKISDPALTDCPQCGKPSFSKQLSAPGFQLKGSGWYATDFKSGTPAAAPSSTDAAPATTTDAPAKSDTPAATASACAPSCACH